MHGVHGNPGVSDMPGTSQNLPKHLKMPNGSVVVVQDQSNGNISRKNSDITFTLIFQSNQYFMNELNY